MKSRLIASGPPGEVLTSENLAKTYGESIVALHLDDIKRIAGWR
jgi:ABC-type cobalamin transport system ATPase subunit